MAPSQLPCLPTPLWRPCSQLSALLKGQFRLTFQTYFSGQRWDYFLVSSVAPGEVAACVLRGACLCGRLPQCGAAARAAATTAAVSPIPAGCKWRMHQVYTSQHQEYQHSSFTIKASKLLLSCTVLVWNKERSVGCAHRCCMDGSDAGGATHTGPFTSVLKETGAKGKSWCSEG